LITGSLFEYQQHLVEESYTVKLLQEEQALPDKIPVDVGKRGHQANRAKTAGVRGLREIEVRC